MINSRARHSPGWTYALPIWIWIGVIFCASSIPGPAIERVGIEFSDKLVHALEYGVLGFLVYRQQRRQFRRRALIGVAIGWLVAAGVGSLDESYQRLIAGRESDLADWIADQAGGLGGAFASAVYLLKAPNPDEGSDAS